MSHIAIVRLIIVGRIVAGCVGVAALYIAFFLFEDEEGNLQNRLEAIWMAIYDRAQQRGSTTAALLNRSGAKMDSIMNHLFGQKLISVRAVLTSLNLSAFGVSLALTVLGFGGAIDASTMWTNIVCVTFTSFCLYALLCSMKPLAAKYVVKFLPPCFFLFYIAYIMWGNMPTFSVVVITLSLALLSLLSDLGMIVLVRVLSRFLAKAISVTRLTVAFAALFAIPALTTLMIVFGWLNNGRTEIPIYIAAVGLLNIATSLCSLIPTAVVAGLLFHLVTWPVLSKLLYPAVRYGLVGSRKTLAAIAVVALTFAFNLEHVGAKELLKLFA